MPGIVVTTDLSPESRIAFAPVRQLAARLQVPVTLLSVLEEMPLEPAISGLMPVYPDRAQLRRDWEAKLVEFARDFHGVETRTSVIEALSVAQAICDFAQREHADYLAIASHGRSGLKRLLLGSVAEAVLRHSRVPVIVYPPK